MKKYFLAAALVVVSVATASWFFGSFEQKKAVISINLCNQNASEVSFIAENYGDDFDWLALMIEHIGTNNETIYKVFGGVEKDKSDNISFDVPAAICENTDAIDIFVDFNSSAIDDDDLDAKLRILNQIKLNLSPSNINVRQVALFEY